MRQGHEDLEYNPDRRRVWWKTAKGLNEERVEAAEDGRRCAESVEEEEGVGGVHEVAIGPRLDDPVVVAVLSSEIALNFHEETTHLWSFWIDRLNVKKCCRVL